MSAGPVHELRKEGKEENGGLWIQDIHDDALAEDTAEFASCLVSGNLEGFLSPQLLNTQIDQIRGAEVLHYTEGGRRGDQQSGKAHRRRGHMDERAYANAECRDQTCGAALTDEIGRASCRERG